MNKKQTQLFVVGSFRYKTVCLHLATKSTTAGSMVLSQSMKVEDTVGLLFGTGEGLLGVLSGLLDTLSSFLSSFLSFTLSPPL